MTTAKMRLVGWNVQPVIMVDDGDNLIPAQVAPQLIAAADWPAFKAGGDEDALNALRAQVAGGSPVEPPAAATPNPRPRAKPKP